MKWPTRRSSHFWRSISTTPRSRRAFSGSDDEESEDDTDGETDEESGGRGGLGLSIGLVVLAVLSYPVERRLDDGPDRDDEL